MINSSI